MHSLGPILVDLNTNSAVQKAQIIGSELLVAKVYA